MKKTIIVLVVMITAAVLGAQTVWTGNATVGDSADFPGTYGNLRAKSNTFPPGTQLRVSNPKDSGFVDVEIVSPLNVPGVLILIEQAAAEAINLPRDHIFPVRVTPTSAAQVGKSFPIIAYNAEKSADPDINPEAMLYGAESFGNYTETLTADSPPEPPVESVVVPSAETAEELTPEPPIESTEEIAAEPPIESAEEIAVPPPEELVVLPPPMPPIETGDEVEDREESQKESRAASLREFQGEFAEDPVKEYRKEIEGEYAEFFEDDLKEETTLSKTDKTGAPPFEDLPEEDSRPAFVAYNPAEDNVSDKAEEGKKSITIPPITEEIEADDSPPFTDDSHLSVGDSLPLTDDKRLRIVEDSPPPTDTPPPVLEGTPPLTDKRLRIVEDSPPLTDAPPPVVEGTPPLTVKDPRMVEDRPLTDTPPPVVEGTPPLTVKDPRMVEDRPLTDTPPPVVEGTPPLTVKSPRMVEDSPLTDDSPRIVEGTPPLTVKSPLIVEDSPPLTDDNPLVEGTPPLTVKSPLIVEDSPPLTDDNSLVEDSPPLTVKSPRIEEDAPPPTDDRAGNGETLEEGIYFLTPSELMPPESDETVEEDALAVDDVLIEEGAPDVGEALPGNDEALAAEEAAPAAPEDGEVVENSRSDGSDGWIRKLELTPVHPGAGELYVQIGSYRNTAVLRDTIGKLKKDTPKYPLSYEVEVRDDGAVYRLLIGPLYPAEKVAVLRTVRSKLSPDAFHYSP